MPSAISTCAAVTRRAAAWAASTLNGSFPNLFLQIDYPLMLPSAYFSTKQTFGKLTLEPGLRYDAETYAIPNRPDTVSPTGVVTKSYAYGPYSTHAFSPRFAFTWAASPYDSFRGSYALTTTFVPAAYVFNDSPNGVFGANSRFVTPYYPGATLSNPLNYNLDLSYSHALRNGIDSFRISPFYRHSTNKLELSKNYVTNPVTGLADLSGILVLPDRHLEQSDGRRVRLEPRRARRRPLVLLLGHVHQLLGLRHELGAGRGHAVRRHHVRDRHRKQRAAAPIPRDRDAVPQPVAAAVEHLVDGRLHRKGRAHVDPFLLYQVGAPYNVAGNTCTNQSFNVIGRPPTRVRRPSTTRRFTSRARITGRRSTSGTTSSSRAGAR